LRYGRERVDRIVDFVASPYLVANWNRRSYSMQSLSRPPRPNGDRSYRGKWWPFPNLIGQRNERLPLNRCKSRIRDRTLFCNPFCFSIIHVITRVGSGPKITSSILTVEQQRRKEMSLAIDMKKPLVDYEVSRDMLISCLIFHLAVVVEYHIASL
jgi:hypothetical protein